MRKMLFLSFLFLFAAPLAHAETSVTIEPEVIIQGDPILVTIDSPDAVAKVTFGGKAIPFFAYQNKTRALTGFDIARTPGNYPLEVTLTTGEKILQDVAVGVREKITNTFDIPQSLGGNNTTSAQTLVSTLAQENATFLGLRTGNHAFWKEPFRSPLAGSLIITDAYGYSRNTSGSSITHKGADFHADTGTPVHAMNRGVVRIVRTYRNYGKTIVIDHGLGLQTYYMHLSKMYVNPGELVLPGQIIGKSGQTGYALGPHLHISVRIKDISIDPVKFLGFFGISIN